MFLSLSTVLTFILLIPAIIFRQIIYSKSVVKRPFGAGNFTHITVNALTIAFILQVVSVVLYLLVAIIMQKFFSYNYTVGLDFSNGKYLLLYNGDSMAPEEFFISHFRFIAWYLVILLVTTITIAKIFSRLSQKLKFIRRMIYGPLSSIMNEDAPTLIYAFALTKIANGEDRVMYMGYLEELALKDGSDINHIVISNPVKFYFRMKKNFPKTTYKNAMPVSENSYSINMMYISGTEIENVHFDQFYGT